MSCLKKLENFTLNNWILMKLIMGVYYSQWQIAFKNSLMTHYSYTERDKVKSDKEYVSSNLPTIELA